MGREKLTMYIALPIWVVLVISGLYAYSNSTLKSFDPVGQLHKVANQANFDVEFANRIGNQLKIATNNIVVHIYSDSTCFCELASASHIASVKTLAEYSDKSTISIAVEEFSWLANIIPSVPSIAVFDGEGQLSYLGPYSTGIGCFTGNGAVEPYINTDANWGAVIPFDAKGCYCNL